MLQNYSRSGGLETLEAKLELFTHLASLRPHVTAGVGKVGALSRFLILKSGKTGLSMSGSNCRSQVLPDFVLGGQEDSDKQQALFASA